VHKQRLLTSVAVAALFAIPGYADTEISSATTTALTTGALLSSGSGTANAGNITIDEDYSVAISKTQIGAITINSDNWLYTDGAVKNTGVSTAYGLHIDVSENPTLNGASFTNADGTTITGAGIYFDSSSSLNLTGDGTGKYGLYFDASTSAGTYTGDVIFNGAALTVDGTSSYGIYFSGNTTFKGDLTFTGASSITMNDGSSTALYLASSAKFIGDITFDSSSVVTLVGNSNTAFSFASGSTITGDVILGGTLTMHQETIRSTSSSSLSALLAAGEIDGNLTVASTGVITVIGAGATGLSIQGTGIQDGALTILGTVETLGYSSTYDSSASNAYTSSTLTTYPEAGTAVAVSANITNGIMISGAAYSGASASTGSVIAYGTSPALSINPSLNGTSQSASLVIGVYEANGEYDSYHPGFSFYNRGTISAQPMNYNSTGEAVYIVGSSAYPTILTGGFYNSGTISATATTNDKSTAVAAATAIYIGSYTYLDNATFDSITGTWADNTLTNKLTSDQAAFVNSKDGSSGTISATVSGAGAGSATALYIDANASVPSLINSGTISASATTTDKTVTTKISSSSSYTLLATAIYDASGTLTSIYNTGTISAVAGVSSSSSTTVSQLDNDAQLGVAINLSSGNTATASGSGVTITERASATGSASIIGDIYFGTGDNQIIDIQGTSSTYMASIIGNIAYGSTGTNAIVDQLNVGAYGLVEGKVTAGSGPGVAVNVATNGTLILENDTTSLNAASVTVADSGNLTLGVSNDLTSTGVIKSKGMVTMASGSNLYLTYNSFIPQGSNDFTLITANYGNIAINSSTLADTNTSLTKSVSDGGSLPYLFKSANLEVTSSTSAGDALVLHVTPKTADQLGITGYASQLFPYVNTALAVDNTLGAAMIYGIHNAKEAQEAYSAFAPNVTGGTRASAISITDQATGPVAARQRSLLMYAKSEPGMSIWANEFIQQIKDPGTGGTSNDGSRDLAGFKDNGFGFAVGMDTGNAKNGWYGAALTYYAGDVGELKRNSKTHEQWILLSGYSVWRGTGLFFNSKLDVGYGMFDGTREIILTTSSASASTATYYTRVADNKHQGALLSGGVSTGTYVNYGSLTLSPTLALDGLVMRENGYTENNPGTATDGDAFDLKVQPYYAKSLRAFLGLDTRYDVNMGDFLLQPELRAGYRYDFFTDPQKLKVSFAYADVSGGTASAGQEFTVTGPDPSKGNLVLGGTLGATTHDWTLGLHFDYVKGTNGAVQQVATFSVVGRL
jgi:hypothetical protein